MHRPWQRPASHTLINHELNFNCSDASRLQRMGEDSTLLLPLSVPKWSPRQILSEKEEEDLFRNVAGYPEAELAHCVAAKPNNATASGVQLRCLKLENVFLRPADEISEI